MIVIVGNGMAGHRLAQSVRRRDPDQPVTVLGAEPAAAYNRVLLSAVLAGTSSSDAVELPDPGVDIRLAARVVGIDVRGRRVSIADGTELPYDQLVLATGSRATLPPVEGLAAADGSPAAGVATFRTLDDCTRITELARGGPMAVLGGGLLGIEAARGLAGLGVDVTLVHPVGHLMERQLDPDSGAVLARVLTGLGVTFRLDTGATSWGSGRLTLTDGSVLDVAGLVVTAGVAPQTWLARRAGLRVERGIVVDDRLATSAAGVAAIGECAEHRGRCHGLVGPCWEQADVLADLLTGTDPAARYRGSAMVTRLKARDIDLAAMGSLDADAEVVTVSDAARGRYGTLAVRDGRIAGAVLLGMPEATGPVIQLHDSGAPAPADRFSLLLGRATAPSRDSPAQLPARAVVCRCNGVSKGDLVAAWRAGARDTGALTVRTRAGTGCGSCREIVAGLCDWLNESDPDVPETEQEEGAA